MEVLKVTTTSQTPIYQQIYDQISSQILNGILKSDTLLPSIRVMAKELRVSIITIKKTWEMLERNDYIYTVAGRGSYVKNNTKIFLEKRKHKTIKDALKDIIILSKQMEVSKEELYHIIEEMFN